MVICNSCGLVVVALVQQLTQLYELVEVEATIACRVLEFGREIGIDGGGRFRHGSEGHGEF